MTGVVPLPESETEPRKPKEGPRVRIIWFEEGESTAQAEKEISLYLADGWRIVAAGGGGGDEVSDGIGFIVLQKD